MQYTLGETLRRLRTERGFTPEGLSAALGISAERFCDWEAGRSEPSLAEARALSDAMGVAPVKEEHAPMKTIRIKRPIDIPTAATAPKAETAPAAAPESAAPAAAGAEASGAATITQRKTLRIARPGSAVRPAGKFGIKRPGAVSAAAKPAGAPAAPTAEGAPSEPAVADIADIPEMPLAAVASPTATTAAANDGPAWLWTLSALVQVAACVVIGALAWFLYENTTILYF